ncbi:MAG: glycerol acyltransferase, partial [Phycisphaerae bacterium]|nr:glycerol acyltransferase [Phycisphaerae bacterium]NIX28315.1 glycerol acyltransferase [Phycisphaerae bacterium]
VKMGQAMASVENGTRLLEQEELVGVFPEGYKGVGKLFKDRYKLARFGRGGFVKMALKTQAPIIPVSVVGAEETYIAVGKSN